MVYNYSPTMDWGKNIEIRFNADIPHTMDKEVSFTLRDQLIKILQEHAKDCELYYRSPRWLSKERFEIDCKLPKEIQVKVHDILCTSNTKELHLKYRTFTEEEKRNKSASSML